MKNDEEQKYIAGLKNYHTKLTQFVKQSYQVDIKYLEVLSWGYHTTAMYLKSSDDKEYLLKLADWSEEKEAGVRKDIELSDLLGDTVPTPRYIKNLNGDYICRFEDKIIRLSHYISGLAPLNMSYDILEQIVDLLKKIHAFSVKNIPANLNMQMDARDIVKQAVIQPTELKKPVLLHGDLTPHNVLVSYDKLVAVMDFELATIGPREYDLARTAVFCWNYMPNESFTDVACSVLEKYSNDMVDVDLVYILALETAQKQVEFTLKHIKNDNKQGDWLRDYDFSLSQFKKLENVRT